MAGRYIDLRTNLSYRRYDTVQRDALHCIVWNCIAFWTTAFRCVMHCANFSWPAFYSCNISIIDMSPIKNCTMMYVLHSHVYNSNQSKTYSIANITAFPNHLQHLLLLMHFSLFHYSTFAASCCFNIGLFFFFFLFLYSEFFISPAIRKWALRIFDGELLSVT